MLAHTPDFDGAIEEGWSKAVTAIIDALVPKGETRRVVRERINILPGCHLTVADLEAIRDTVEAFGLEPIILPDISGSLDGTVPERWIPTTYGGTSVEDIRDHGRRRPHHRHRRAHAPPRRGARGAHRGALHAVRHADRA